MRKKLNMIFLFFYVVALFLMMLSPELIMLFGSNKYAGAVYVIPPVAVSTFFIYLYSILSTMQFYYEKTQFMLFASIIAACLNILLNYIFVNRFGFVAAGYTTLFCYVVYCIGHHIMSQHIARKYNGGENIYDTKFVLIISIVVIITGILSNLLFNLRLIRYGLLIVIVAMAIIRRNDLMRLMSEIKK